MLVLSTIRSEVKAMQTIIKIYILRGEPIIMLPFKLNVTVN